MSQFDFGDLESPLSGTALINSNLEPWRDALHSQHSGNSAPSYVTAGMIWWNTTTNPWVLNAFDGSDHIELGKLDTTLNSFTPANIPTQWAGSAGGSANALTFTPTPAFTAYTTGKAWEGQITTTNTAAAPTVNVSGLGNLTIKTFLGVGKVNVPIGCLQSGMIARFVYDGTDAILLNPRAYNPSASIATASTINLDTATGDYVELTGTTTCTAITLANGQQRTCRAAGAFILTNGASLIIPGSANITTAAGDVFTVRGEPSGVVRVVHYQKANGQSLGGGGTPTFHTMSSSGTFNVPAGAKAMLVELAGAGGGGHGFQGSAGGTGGDTTWDTGGSPIVAKGGQGGQTNAPGAGGTGGTGTADERYNGNPGIPAYYYGSAGGSHPFFAGAGKAGAAGSGTGRLDGTKGGGGAGGDAGTNANASGLPGGSGEAVRKYYTTLASSYAYTIGTGGAFSVGNVTPARDGTNGGNGFIRVTCFY